MGLWDELPFDLVNKIDEHLEIYQDKVRSKCVCTHWQHALPELLDFRQERTPWLLMPFTSGSLCRLFQPLEKKLLLIDLPEIGEKVYKGSGHGCVVTAQLDGSIDVINPLTRVRFALPPRHKFTDVLEYNPEKVGHEYLSRPFWIGNRDHSEQPYTNDSRSVRNYLLQKIALSCAPTRGRRDFTAVAIYGETYRLAYCRLGDEKWTDLVKLKDESVTYQDVTFCGGKLYALTTKFELMVCDDIGSPLKLRKLLPSWKGFGRFSFDLRLINSSYGGIMLARRYRESTPNHRHFTSTYKTVDFEIYRMDLTSSGWIRMESLPHDEILFMGLGMQLSIRGRTGNQIYFTHQELNLKGENIDDKDDGIFRLKDKEIESLGYESITFQSPIWVIPDPY